LRIELAIPERGKSGDGRHLKSYFKAESESSFWARLAEIFTPSRPFAQGSLVEIFGRYPCIGRALPAMGYSDTQLQDLSATINGAACDSIIVATPVDLARLIRLPKHHCRVRYDLEEISRPALSDVIAIFLQTHSQRRRLES